MRVNVRKFCQGYVDSLISRTKGNLIFIAGPSGVGKSTLLKKSGILEGDSEFVEIDRYLVRPQRDIYDNGHFVNDSTFDELVHSNQMLTFVDNKILKEGISFSEYNELIKGKNVVVTSGLLFENLPLKFKESKNVKSVVVLPQETNVIIERLKKRNTEPIEKIMERVELGKRYIDISGIFDYRVINDNLDKAFWDFNKAMKMSRRNRLHFLYTIKRILKKNTLESNYIRRIVNEN